MAVKAVHFSQPLAVQVMYDKSPRVVEYYYHSSCRTAPQPGTLPCSPVLSPHPEKPAHSCLSHIGNDSCSSSASPLFARTPSAHRIHPNSTQWDSHGDPEHSQGGSCCLWDRREIRIINIVKDILKLVVSIVFCAVLLLY